MAGKMWFGTRGFETWVRAPAINPSYGRVGYSNGEQTGLNGTGFTSGSKSAHNTYQLTWSPTASRDAIRAIEDFADGVYDTVSGINLIYWIDPMAADKNVLPQNWATPSLAVEDGVPLVSDAFGRTRPIAVATPSNELRYPARSARYSMKSDSSTMELYIPIPPGYSAWVGIHGDTAAQDVIQVDRVRGATVVSTGAKPVVLPTTSLTRVNTEFSSADSSGIVLRFAKPTNSNTLVFILHGLMVQILPIGSPPKIGGFVSGQGHAGCQFVGKVQKTPYSAMLGEDGRVGASATLKETGMGL